MLFYGLKLEVSDLETLTPRRNRCILSMSRLTSRRKPASAKTELQRVCKSLKSLSYSSTQTSTVETQSNPHRRPNTQCVTSREKPPRATFGPVAAPNKSRLAKPAFQNKLVWLCTEEQHSHTLNTKRLSREGFAAGGPAFRRFMESAPSNAGWPELRIALVTESRMQRGQSQCPFCGCIPGAASPSPLQPRHGSARLLTDRTAAPSSRFPRNPRQPRSHSSPFPGCGSWRARSGRCCAAGPPAPPHPAPWRGAARHSAANGLLLDSNCAPPPRSPPSIGSRSNQPCCCIQSKRAEGGLCILIRCWCCSVPDHPASKSCLSERATRGVGSLLNLATAADRGLPLAAGAHWPRAPIGCEFPLAAGSRWRRRTAHGGAQGPGPTVGRRSRLGRRWLGAPSGLGSLWHRCADLQSGVSLSDSAQTARAIGLGNLVFRARESRPPRSVS